MKHILFSLMMIFSVIVNAQDTKPFIPEGDATYFDFWPGTWMEQRPDKSLDSNSYFRISRGVHPSCFTEEWRYANGMTAIATRAWDKTNNKWGFVWVSDNGLFQVWDSKKIDGHWYIYKQFTVNNDTYLSRQSFVLQPDGTVIQTSEKSYDEVRWKPGLKRY